MSDQVADRIERALKRIEVAAASQARSRAGLARRNEMLRMRIESAIADLDVLIARETENEIPMADDAEDEG
jgi:tRNA threonylcarbamoyladenosine modification (KEOPS) complex  Pcc1 subunit